MGLWVCIAGLAVAAAARNGSYVESTQGDQTHWTGLKWSADDIALFGGAPHYNGTDSHVVLLRYSFFVSNYDLDRLSPLWVAHVDERDSSDKLRGRKKGPWSRKDDVFEPDGLVVRLSKSWRLSFATNESFSNANPPELPTGEKGYAKITRGHMASNQEMKAQGDVEEGLASQKESFSLANVVPQMQHHNAPIWAKLEDDCLIWAAKLGRVAVISGPVYAPDPGQPLPSSRCLFTLGRDGVRIPIPTHLFKVVIGRLDGHVVAVGFLIPHRADLSLADLPSYVVPIRQIEALTGINFMPLLGSNDGVELQRDARWLAMIPASKAPEERRAARVEQHALN